MADPLPPEFYDRVERLTNSQFDELRERLPAEVGRVKSEHAGRGVLYSSMTVNRIVSLFENEVAARAIVIWQNMIRVHQALGPAWSAGLGSIFKQEFSTRLTATCAELSEGLKQQLMPFERQAASFAQRVSALDARREHAISKYDVEIDLYVDSLKSRESTPGLENPATYNFHGNVGAVLTGSNATANVVQGLTPEDLQSIVNALVQLRGAVQSDEGLTESQRREIIEIAEETNRELKSDNPNNTKLRSFLSMLSNIAKTVKDGTDAFQGIKGVLLSLGIGDL